MWTKRYPHSNRSLGPFCIQGECKITDKQLALKTLKRQNLDHWCKPTVFLEHYSSFLKNPKTYLMALPCILNSF